MSNKEYKYYPMSNGKVIMKEIKKNKRDYSSRPFLEDVTCIHCGSKGVHILDYGGTSVRTIYTCICYDCDETFTM